MTIETELPAVKVRELEWREDWGGSLEDIPEWRAKTPWGSITVSVAGHRDAGGNRYERHSDVSEELYRRLIGTAQADYERRILSALVPSTPAESRCEELVKALEPVTHEELSHFIRDKAESHKGMLQPDFWPWLAMYLMEEFSISVKASDDLKEAEGVVR